jgi:Amidase
MDERKRFMMRFQIEEATILDLQQAMTEGQITARELAELYIARIQQLNHDGPELNAVIEVNPDALEIAIQLDAERAEQGARGPLHGIPLLLKDNIATRDKMKTTAGSLALVRCQRVLSLSYQLALPLWEVPSVNQRLSSWHMHLSKAPCIGEHHAFYQQLNSIETYADAFSNGIISRRDETRKPIHVLSL